MNHFTQHIPTFCDGFTPIQFTFEDISELMNHELLQTFAQQKDFHRFSLSGDLLMSENNEGKKWWVIGHIKHPDKLDLPQWQPQKSDIPKV